LPPPIHWSHRHNAIIEERTAAEGGTVVETQGDGSMLAFPSARRAVACAEAIQRDTGGTFVDVSPPVAVRIGVHTGDVKGLDGRHRLYALDFAPTELPASVDRRDSTARSHSRSPGERGGKAVSCSVGRATRDIGRVVA
jgi:hypothetical protein